MERSPLGSVYTRREGQDPPLRYKCEIAVGERLAPSDEGAGFLRSKKTEGVKIKDESQEVEKIEKLSLRHSARYTSRSCQLPPQMEPRNKVI